MDNIFFIFSKLLWNVIIPENFIIFSLILITLLFYLKKEQLAKKALYIFTSALLIIAMFPVGSWLIYPLETRFKVHPKLPEKIDGIILLGGSFLPQTSHSWNKPQTNLFADRVFSFVSLLNKYPNAKAIFTGGQASIDKKYPSEAFYAQQLFNDLGIAKGRILFEDKARNTYENAVFTKQLAQPQANETWIVITTAFHLPRSVGVFCQQNWAVIPYPSDFHSNPKGTLTPSLSLAGHLGTLNYAIHEWLGLVAYYITGKTTSLLPSQCH